MGAVLAEPALVRICDLAGRPRGTGFLADHTGTVITSHEAVDGLSRLVVHAHDARTHLAKAGDITPLPEWDLALIRTDGLHVAPLVIGAERARTAGMPVRLRTGHTTPRRAGCWTDAQLAGTASVTYTSTDCFHALEEVLELALPEAAAVELHLSRRASGSPVLDAGTGAVLAVLGTALHAPDRTAVFAVPLRAAGLWEPEGPLSALLARNAATVPGFGPDLNLAGALRLTEVSVRPAVERVALHVPRPQVADALRRFMESDASAVALVGEAGTGRSTELAAFAAQHAGEAVPAPTVWLRGADVRAGDGSVREAVGRVLAEAGRVVAASGPPGAVRHTPGGECAPSADVVARLARDAKRPLLVLLDAPEEMPATLFSELRQELRQWTTGTAGWLRAAGARMVIACGPELWEQAGAFFPHAMLHEGRGETTGGAQSSAALPPCVRLGDLPPEQAARARERYGLDADALCEEDKGHPLAMRMLAEVRAALGAGPSSGLCNGRTASADDLTVNSGSTPPSRSGIFSAHLDLAALRIARRLAAAQGRTARNGDVRRLAARTAGALHELARRCLGAGRGGVGHADFEEVFPERGGWASAVLTEGVLEPAGEGFRFADEEFADWLQGRHLEVDAALETLVHGQDEPGATAPVPRHRIGPVVQALLLCAEVGGPETLESRLLRLTGACFADDRPEGVWWATHLIEETLLRVPDARPYSSVLRALSERISTDGHTGGFGPWFWRRLALPAARKTELLRLLLPADPPHGADSIRGRERYLDVVDELVASEPKAVQPLLCAWFTDRRLLSSRADVSNCADGEGDADGEGVPRPTVASAAQALLYAHRGRATQQLLDLLIDACHPRADELLGELSQDEPAALCHAVEHWANDERSLRRTAAAEYGLQMVVHARTDADRERLDRAARALLSRPGELAQHDSALALLLHISADREQYLDAALDRLAAAGAPELSDALAAALRDRPEPVLTAFRVRLCEPGSGARHLVQSLANVQDPDLARPTAELVREYAELRPERAGEALAAFVRLRLTHRAEGRAGLQLLTDALLSTPYAPLRASLARAFAAARSGPVRDELLDVLLLGECDLGVLDAALVAVVRRDAEESGGEQEGAYGSTRDAGRREQGQEREQDQDQKQDQGELVRRIGLLMARTPEGLACFDRRLVGLSREVPGFGGLLRNWAAASPRAWTAVAGPGARSLCESPADRG